MNSMLAEFGEQGPVEKKRTLTHGAEARTGPGRWCDFKKGENGGKEFELGVVSVCGGNWFFFSRSCVARGMLQEFAGFDCIESGCW